MNKKNRIISMLAILILMISISIPNVAALVIKKNLADLTKDADSIVVGNVADIKSYKENGLIFTDVTVLVDMRLKGKPDDNVVVKVPGGTVDGLFAEVSDAPYFEEGQNVILFSKGKDVVGMEQGKFTINKGKILENDETLAEFVQKVKDEAKVSPKKGDTGRSIGVMSKKLDANSLVQIPPNSSKDNTTVEPPVGNDAWTNIKTEGFEGAFPNTWTMFGSPTWCDNNYRYAVGSWSGWPACGGTGAVPAGGLYPNNLDSWMVFGPFDLTGATAAKVTFKHYTETEPSFDLFAVAASTSLYGTYYGTYWDGDWRPWRDETLDLSGYLGQSAVYVAFVFQSDSSIQKNGTYLDEIVISKDSAVSTTPHITGVSPISGPAKAASLGSSTPAADSTQVTITGTNFGAATGSVEFWRTGTTVYNAAIVSWTDTQIVAKVPGRISSWTTSSGTGNVQVINSAGNPSDNYGNFRVTYSYGGGKWPGTGLTYKVNPNTLDTDGELAAAQAGANTWSNAGANFAFTYGGTSTQTAMGLNGENSILWRPGIGSGILAVCWTWGSGNTITENDIEFNDDYSWSTTGAAGTYDIQTIATHELGHELQLLDMYGSQDSSKVMYGYGSPGTTKRDLNVDDVDGIKAIYGAATGRKLMTFARGSDNALWFRKYDGVGWGTWQSLGGIVSSEPDAVSSAPNKVDVVVRGSDNALWIRRYDGAAWSAWQSLGGNFNSGPGIASSSTNLLEVFARNAADNALWVKRYDGTAWGSWQSLGGILSSDPDASNKLDIVVRGADNALWIKRYSGGAWGAWQSLGGIINSGPTAASSGASNLDVFARGADNALWQKSWNGASWGAWQSLGGIISSDSDATSAGIGIDIVTRGADNALWQKTWNGASWGAWGSLGGIINSGPTIASWT